MRKSGILMHLASLPSEYGVERWGQRQESLLISSAMQDSSIGSFCQSVPTSYGDSPYQSFSTFAGNPYFIDLDLLAS